MFFARSDLASPAIRTESPPLATALGTRRDRYSHERYPTQLQPGESPEEFLDETEAPLIRVLAVEDSRMDMLLLENELGHAKSVRFEITPVARISEAKEMLSRNEFDVVVTDLGLPDSTGLETFLAINDAARRLPVIVMTSHNDERMGIRAMREGAGDYFVKGSIRRDGLARAIRDAIQRRRVEEWLRRSEERFRSSIDSLLDGFALLTARRSDNGEVSEFQVDYINASGLSLRPTAEPMPFPFLLNDLFPDCHTRGLFAELLRISEGAHASSGESVLLCQEVENHSTTPSYDFRAAKTEEGIALTWRDVTLRLRLEAQVLQAQKMNSIGQLAGGIAHDFNNLLTVIHGHADVMRDSNRLPSELTESVKEISSAAVRATNLTSQLLTFSRQHPMIPADVDINDTVVQMSNMLGRILGKDIRLQVDLRQPAPFVRADRTMIDQILLNLAVNSRDAMPNGGELGISTTVRMVKEFELDSEPDTAAGEFVCLTVTDTGCGMEKNQLGKIFEPFYSTKEVGKGTGLGLAMVYGIVKQHKGLIRVQSEIGLGTTFQVYLPRCSAKPAAPPPVFETSKLSGGHETILLVDDEETISEMGKMFLESQGYHVITAGNGPEAVKIWQEDKTRIDMLFTDLVMPQGVTGLELARQLREDRPDLKVIYSSGYSCDIVGETSFLSPGTHFLQKPYRLQSLAEMIRHCFDEVADVVNA